MVLSMLANFKMEFIMVLVYVIGLMVVAGMKVNGKIICFMVKVFVF